MILLTVRLNGQKDIDPPKAPLLGLVTVNQTTWDVDIKWYLSSSPDVSGYVVYLFKNNEGYALDTIHDPFATTYTRSGTGASYYSESFVVAALDSSGNISPLSNPLNTIYTASSIDTCNNRISLRWNSYPSYPKQVKSYSIFCSVDGAAFNEVAQADRDKNDLTVNDFETGRQYCFAVQANLENGFVSGSNKSCLSTRMQRPPRWINADYATVAGGNKINLSFSIDPLSEIHNFRLERKTGKSGTYAGIFNSPTVTGSLQYTDNEADPTKVNYYRLTAVNNCGSAVIWSNTASNIVLSLERNNNDIRLSWNPYLEWAGNISSYKLLMDTGGELKERLVVLPPDTSVTVRYSDFMYEVTGSEICFIIEASEASNPHAEPGKSRSSEACTSGSELVTVPNTFTPDGNGINDYFGPILSFTPSSYRFMITDMRRKMIFESVDFNEKWDGKSNGDPLPEGVYLWFLKVITPSGKEITKTGTLTIVFNR